MSIADRLFLAALRWLQTDGVARAWYNRKVRHNDGVKLKVVAALMRKLLAALYHIAREAPYDARTLFDYRWLHLDRGVRRTVKHEATQLTGSRTSRVPS